MKKYITYIVLALLFVFPSVSMASFDVSLKYGSKGDSVIELQDFLNYQGIYSGKVDGKFGFGTLKAVKSFQSVNGLSPDGYFGKASRAKANELLSLELKSSDEAEKAETGTISAPVIQVPAIQSTPIVIEQPIISNIAPVIMKDIIVTQISPAGDTAKVFDCFVFSVIIKDNDGENLNSAYPIQMKSDKQPNQILNFGGGGDKNTATYCPQEKGSHVLTFSYKPLNLSKSLTIVAIEQ